MRLGVYGWAGLTLLLIAGLAARVVWRPPSGGSLSDADAQREASPLVRLRVVASG